MMKFALFFLVSCIICGNLAAQIPDTLWSQIHSISPMGDIDEGKCVRQTAEGGYIITGSCVPNGMVNAVDVLLLKTDTEGNIQWIRTYDRTFIEEGLAVEQTPDEGFIIGGRTCTGPYPIPIQSDVWMLKADSNGDTLWTKTYGGEGHDYCTSIQQTSDLGYILAGTKDSEYAWPNYEVNEEYEPETSRAWLLKTNASGDTLWTRTYMEKSHGTSVVQTSDGGYIISGYIFPDVGDNQSDVLLIKTDAGGNTLWTSIIGGEDYEIGLCVRPTQGGYVITGQTKPEGQPYDALLIKTDLSGNVLWRVTYGGYLNDSGSTVEVTTDGGFFITGTTNGTWWIHGGDAWVFKTDSDGNLIWQNIYSLAVSDFAWCGIQCTDGGYVVTGLVGYGFGGDLWLAKIGVVSADLSLTVIPYNPPIIIPATGGSFDFNIEVINNEPDTVQFDIWTYATLPGGTQYGPILNRQGAILSAGSSVERDFTQTVPEFAPEGDYTYDVYVGIYPDNVWNEDHFDFSKSAVTPGGSPVNDWVCRETGAGGLAEAMPNTTVLHSAYPNPFNPSTVLSYKLKAASYVNLAVYDCSGRKVAELVNGWRDKGYHEATFDGSHLASGIYVFTLKAGGFTKSGKMVLMK